ncbi:MAG: WD40 repeat domain-containing protein, partial [Microcystaceae cyanobacterium]
SWDGTVRLWHVPTGKEMKPAFEHPDYINAIAYRQDGHYLAAGSRKGRIYIWNLLTGQEHKCLEGHTHSINSLTFYGQILIAGDQDGIVRCWQI